MTIPQDPQQYIHRAAVDAEGNRIGKISQVYLDDKTEQPLWVLVETGLFGTRQSFAPIHGSRCDGERVVLAVSKDQVKDAPNIDRDTQLSESEQDALRQHYSGYLGTTAQASSYEESQQARQWDSGQEPAFRIAASTAARRANPPPPGPLPCRIRPHRRTITVPAARAEGRLAKRLRRSLLARRDRGLDGRRRSTVVRAQARRRCSSHPARGAGRHHLGSA